MKKFWFSLLCLLPIQVFAVLPEINFAPQTNVYKEGETVTLTVDLSAPTIEGVSVKLYLASYSTAGMADTDLNLSSTVIYISPGESRGSISFKVLEDSEIESTEYFALRMGAPQNATMGTNNTLLLNFIEELSNETVLPKVNFSTTSSEVSEQGTVEVKLTLSATSDSPVVVPLSICGTAEYPTDHNLLTDEVVFHPGTTEAILSINIFSDVILEGTEDIVIGITSPMTNAELGSVIEHTVLINDVYEPGPGQ